MNPEHNSELADYRRGSSESAGPLAGLPARHQRIVEYALRFLLANVGDEWEYIDKFSSEEDVAEAVRSTAAALRIEVE